LLDDPCEHRPRLVILEPAHQADAAVVRRDGPGIQGRALTGRIRLAAGCKQRRNC
jgi:hypothetical protein